MLFGWSLVIPIIGLVLGISSLRRERFARGRAGWGIALNVVAMAGWVLGLLVIVMLGGFAALAGLAA